MKVCAVIPAYNEEKTIGSVIQNVPRGVVDEIFVIDDGSTDNVYATSKNAGAKVIKHAINRGIGAAQRTGYKIARLENFDYVVQIDADMQHDPKYIQKLLDTAIENNCDMVIGSRFLNSSYENYSFVRRAGIKFFTRTVRFLSPVDITDVTSGFRVYKVKSLEKLGRTLDKHWAVEQTLDAAKKGLKIKEVSVKMPLRKKGKSQFNLITYVKYPLRMIESILRVLIFRR